MGYLERLDSYKDDMLRTLEESIAIPSVKSEPVRTKDGELMPFGRRVHEAFMHMLETGKEMGFETYNDENYAGHIEFRSSEGGDDYFGVVGHLDVVPEGDGWSGDPFKVLDNGEGMLFGRGVSDDKGPVIASLYAMKALKEEGIVPKCNIRLVLGLDEETGSISADHYTEHCGQPFMGFTPDGDFPVVNGEMGIIVFELAQKFTQKPAKDELRLTKLEGGTVHNAVPAHARAVIAGSSSQYESIIEKAKLYTEETGRQIKVKKQGSSLVIDAAGKAAHGAHPDLGVNAISILMDFLGNISFAGDELNDFIAFYNDNIGFDLHGERMGCCFEDEESGALIFNVGVANINEEIGSLQINIRYPVTITDDQVFEKIEETIDGSRLGIVTRTIHKPVYMDMNSEMVRKLLAAYREETGDEESQPMVIPGGTYAKMFNNILCYGGLFPGEPDTMHQADEQLSVDSFMKMARIFARALYYLCCE